MDIRITYKKIFAAIILLMCTAFLCACGGKSGSDKTALSDTLSSGDTQIWYFCNADSSGKASADSQVTKVIVLKDGKARVYQMPDYDYWDQSTVKFDYVRAYMSVFAGLGSSKAEAKAKELDGKWIANEIKAQASAADISGYTVPCRKFKVFIDTSDNSVKDEGFVLTEVYVGRASNKITEKTTGYSGYGTDSVSCSVGGDHFSGYAEKDQNGNATKFMLTKCSSDTKYEFDSADSSSTEYFLVDPKWTE